MALEQSHGSSLACALIAIINVKSCAWEGQPGPHAPPVLQSQDHCLGSGQVLGRAWPPEYPVRLYPTGFAQGQPGFTADISWGT